MLSLQPPLVDLLLDISPTISERINSTTAERGGMKSRYERLAHALAEEALGIRPAGSVDRRNLFVSTLAEYLSLPSLQELEFDFSVWNAKRREAPRVFDRVYELWEALGSPSYLREEELKPGTLVAIQDVQLIEYVSRNPGYIGSAGYRGRWTSNEDVLLTPSFTWVELRQLRHRTVALLGLGDVRFTEFNGRMRLLNVVSVGKGALARRFSLRERPDPNEILQVSDEQTRAHLDDAYGFHARYENEDLNLQPLALGGRLRDHVQSIYASSYSADELSIGGFPLLVTPGVYDRIADRMQRFGAVRLRELTGILVQIPPDFPLVYGPGRPRWCLVAGAASGLAGVDDPNPVVCSAWTVTVDDQTGKLPEEKYLQWMFKVGVKGWRSQVEQAVDVVESVRVRTGGTALFEFDEESNWFGDGAVFTPRAIREMHKSLISQRGHQEVIMRDKYEISGQAGAVGPEAHAHDLEFKQTQQHYRPQFDLAELARELEILRQELRQQATTSEHDIAVVEVGAAVEAAERGDEPETLNRLRRAGRWALEAATAIGTGVAANAIQASLGG
ncbi:hypothetical protein [Streptomyces sp. 11x1]|uniref:hypothetical protein n=1 Tax=Streptomyces sp. 11x1 TaxID=3038642 RepID=UPI00292E6456|nr:hypothetical protein [Streptomyces sp. 11x1]WNZ06173.1 hypothetical protein P8T65_00225 [Streptomyces sp. 11x1]